MCLFLNAYIKELHLEEEQSSAKKSSCQVKINRVKLLTLQVNKSIVWQDY